MLAVAGTLWLRDTLELLRFLVALLGRMPLVTPVWVYAALMLACGAMVVPPFVAAVAATKPLLRPSLVSAVLLVAVVVTGGIAYAAPAYTFDQPQRRYLRVLTEPGATTSTYEVGSQEPGLDLDPSAPGGWYWATDEPKTSVPVGRFGPPYVFRTTAPTPGARAGHGQSVHAQADRRRHRTDDDHHAAGARPDRGVRAAGRRGAVAKQPAGDDGRAGAGARRYIGIPPEGVTWRASFKKGAESRLPATQAVILSTRFPGGSGWQSLPAWLPQEHVVWDATVAWVLAPGRDRAGRRAAVR